jgi:tRNA(fMet)-specific endonuclease VapC
MYMLDTNTCIFVLKNRDDKLRRKFKAIKSLCMSSVTYGELCYGIENGVATLRQERFEQLDLFTQRVLIEPWDEEAARHYGTIRAHLKREGRIIGSNDLLIAAHARSIDAVIVTNNTSEFSRVPDLTVEDWLEKI